MVFSSKFRKYPKKDVLLSIVYTLYTLCAHMRAKFCQFLQKTRAVAAGTQARPCFLHAPFPNFVIALSIDQKHVKNPQKTLRKTSPKKLKNLKKATLQKAHFVLRFKAKKSLFPPSKTRFFGTKMRVFCHRGYLGHKDLSCVVLLCILATSS